MATYILATDAPRRLTLDSRRYSVDARIRYTAEFVDGYTLISKYRHINARHGRICIDYVQQERNDVVSALIIGNGDRYRRRVDGGFRSLEATTPMFRSHRQIE